MPLTLVLPQRYGWVALAAGSTFWLCIYQAVNVSKARAKAGVKYPYPYAEKAEAENSKEAMIFNCAQRAHANTLENLPLVLFSTMLAGLRFPIPAAAACGVWVATRVLYTIAYTTGDPMKRNKTNGGYTWLVALLSLGGMSTWTAVDMILQPTL